MRKQVGKMVGMTCLAAGCIGLLAGCGQSSESVTMDTTALADELQESGIFSSELTKVDDEAASLSLIHICRVLCQLAVLAEGAVKIAA